MERCNSCPRCVEGVAPAQLPKLRCRHVGAEGSRRFAGEGWPQVAFEQHNSAEGDCSRRTLSLKIVKTHFDVRVVAGLLLVLLCASSSLLSCGGGASTTLPASSTDPPASGVTP